MTRAKEGERERGSERERERAERREREDDRVKGILESSLLLKMVK